MSEPQTINEYLARFNACLEVGFRSRWRIFTEIADHLAQAAEHHTAAGVSPGEAQRRAIAAFGSPETVASAFEAGLVGALDKRLGMIARRLGVWRAADPWSNMALFVPAAAAIVALGATFGVATAAGIAGGLLGIAAVNCWAEARDRRQTRQRVPALPPHAAGARTAAQFGWVPVLWLAGLAAVAGSTTGGWACVLAYQAVWVGGMGLQVLSERFGAPGAGSFDHARWNAYRAKHRWGAALLTDAGRVMASALIALVAVLLLADRPDLKVALALTIVAIPVVVIPLRRLAFNRDEQQRIQHSLSSDDTPGQGGGT